MSLNLYMNFHRAETTMTEVKAYVHSVTPN